MIEVRDLDNLSARLHGRRSRLADGERLRSLCALASPAELAGALFPGSDLSYSRQVQGRLAVDYVREARELASVLGGARARFIEWTAARLQLENIKVMVRAISAGFPPAAARPLLMQLPDWPGIHGPGLAGAGTPEDLAEALPQGVLRRGLERAYSDRNEGNGSFFVEAALDREYLAELLVRLAGLPRSDREYTSALVRQEIAIFDLMLAARGRFFYGLEKKDLLPLFAPGSDLNERKFSALLSAPGVHSLRGLAAGLAVEAGPPEADPSALEALAWGRYARLAARAFRGSHMGFGAVAGYLAMRRLEVSNLITVAEGLRLGVPAAELRPRLLPRTGGLH